MAEQIERSFAADQEQWLTTREAAELTPYTWGTIRQYCSRGTIPAVQRSGMWFIHIRDLMDYVDRMRAEGAQKHTPKAKRKAGD